MLPLELAEAYSNYNEDDQDDNNPVDFQNIFFDKLDAEVKILKDSKSQLSKYLMGRLKEEGDSLRDISESDPGLQLLSDCFPLSDKDVRAEVMSSLDTIRTICEPFVRYPPWPIPCADPSKLLGAWSGIESDPEVDRDEREYRWCVERLLGAISSNVCLTTNSVKETGIFLQLVTGLEEDVKTAKQMLSEAWEKDDAISIRRNGRVAGTTSDTDLAKD